MTSLADSLHLEPHPLGFREAQPKPTAQELAAFYNDKYYSDQSTFYYRELTEDEHLNKVIAPDEALTYAGNVSHKHVLEIGCGEGFFMERFHQHGWQVTGLDFTSDGVSHFHPHLAEHVVLGDIYDSLQSPTVTGQQYGLIACNHVIEHVSDPVKLLTLVKPLLAPGGVCRFVVPNDESAFHYAMVDKQLAPPDFWVALPDHLCYFNADSFQNLIRSSGFEVVDLLADFPIELFMWNPDTNYKRDDSKGKNCHLTRMAIENFIAKQGIDKLTAFRRGSAHAGIGRSLIAYCQLAGG